MSAVELGSVADLATTTSGPDEISRRLEALPTSGYVWRLVILLSLGGCFEIYDLFFTGYIAPGLARSGLMTTTTQAFFGFSGIGAFVAATFAGLFIGTFCLGFLADRFGRKAVFTWSLLFYSAASVIMACQTTPGGLLLWRFIAGIGIGIEVITIDAYITELVPSWMRGRAFAINQAVMLSAVPIVAALSWWLVPLSPHGIDGWRWVVLIGAAASMIIWVLRLYVPESPLWLARHGRAAEAETIMRTLEAASPTAAPRPIATAAMVPARAPAETGYADLFRPPYASLVVLFMIFNLCQAFGVYGFSNWVPALLVQKGINVTKSLQYSFIIAFAYPLAPLLAATFADRLERKWIICGAAAAISVFGLAFSQLTEPVLLIASGVLVTGANMTLSYAYHAYQTEVFPTAIRARAAGLVYSMSRLSATFSGFIVAFMLKEAGVGGVFGLITAAMVIVIIAIGVWGPNVRGRPLDA
ncbi:putative MFS transporter [Bradyrhizobium sp. USDA 4524]|uniref:MFS transporter n=1 Tax=Bradyrhizobium TaxID=374 RepID=UPI00209FBE59|nr:MULTISPECIES: MFS transporter [Bradyrhizobium]MCP1840579.1 putative MFS transporter [Bradyrhizobium sp. USDA 4538]MCP1901143.1 putative MFS transporter [Bradyrhizobium sp. USDA 4537]MCP1993201.1 putative MFS transporter [Bradyrhizobium sp. USDA 4539]MCP3415553.1 MFS transporter [Bradyrhizobium brasilense]